MATKKTKLELEQLNLKLANENLNLRTELSQLRARVEDKGPRYVSARPGFQRALRVLAGRYPERKSFTQTEVLAVATELKGARS